MSETILITVPLEQLAEMIETGIAKALVREMKPNPEKLYSFYKAAKILGIHYDTLKRLTERGKIAATADGRFVSQQAIDDFLNLKK